MVLSKENDPEEKFSELELEMLTEALKNLKNRSIDYTTLLCRRAQCIRNSRNFKLTNGRISQIKSIAIKKLRNEIKNILNMSEWLQVKNLEMLVLKSELNLDLQK